VRLIHQTPTEDDDLARRLQRHLRHLPVVMLEDRLLPTGMVVDFLAIGPGGITVIADAGPVEGPLRVERLRGIFGSSAEVLCDRGAADRTTLLVPVVQRVATVKRIVAGDAGVVGALCLDDRAPEALRPLHAHGILVAGARSVAGLAARHGSLVDTEVAELVDRLHATCPPALL
jgi:hypothetical protein